MNRFAPTIGLIGASLGMAGLIAYSIAPEKLWLVTLCEGIALICLIVFFVLHFESLKAFSTRRSTRMGLNSVLMVALFIGILVIANFLASRHSQQWDLSETQHFTLSPQTHRVLRGLTREVKVTVFTNDTKPSASTYRDLLDAYRLNSDKLRVEFVDPERKPSLARQYGVTRSDTAVFESGPEIIRVNTASEAELTSALIRVSRDTKKRIVFLEGHGERSLTDPEDTGLTNAKSVLEKQGYEVSAITLLQEPSLPENTAVLVLAGPRRPVTKEEKDRIATYVADGGRLLIMVDPETQPELDDLVGPWGIEIGRGVLVDPKNRLSQGDLTALLVSVFGEHEITQDFTFVVLFPFSRHLTFQEDNGKGWDIAPLARTSETSWAEQDYKGRVYTKNKDRDVQGPLWLAAALTPKQAPPEGKQKAAVVIVGNSSFASNVHVNFPGNTDFLLHTIAWLAEERDLISITPKEPAMRPFIPSPSQQSILFYVQVLFLPALAFFWGFLTWRRRRRL